MAEENTAEQFVGNAIRLYSRYADRKTMPTNRRVFLESIVDKRRDPITEASFTPNEIIELSKLVSNKYSPLHEKTDQYATYLQNELTSHAAAVKAKNRDKMMYPEFVAQYQKDLSAINSFRAGKLTQDFLALASGEQTPARDSAMRYASTAGKNLQDAFNIKPYITYSDYGQNRDEVTAAHSTASTDPRAMLRTTLGQFNYAVDPKTGGLVVTDNYDFNASNLAAGQPLSETNLPEELGGGLYNVIRQYAGQVLPPGTGRPVRVQTNALAPPIQNSFVR